MLLSRFRHLRQRSLGLTLPLTDILTWLWQRWELEVAHRHMKSGLGLGEKQCWNQHATLATVNGRFGFIPS
ncbi:MAG: hypothetical protein R3E79_09440 [Caldilineaceae bacterium]